MITLWLLTPKKVSYGYFISFAEIQFGNINGEKYPDLFTCGCHGMSYGNPAWFIGRGTHFDDWEHEQMLPTKIGQQTAVLVDLDNDGYMDIMGTTFLINENGRFFREVPVSSSDLYSLCFARERRFSIIAHPLTPEDRFSELILNSPSFRSTLIGICKENNTWSFYPFESNLYAALDQSDPRNPALLILNNPAEEILALFDKYNIMYRQVALDSLNKLHRPVFLFNDINSNGENELVAWSASQNKSLVSVFKEADGHFELIYSFETEEHKSGRYDGHYSYAEFKFVDFDLDGKIDFIGDDGWIYLQKDNYRFEKAKHVKMRRSKEASFLYACDINADGYPDVISSYQPFTNIRLGPFF
ncbi:MAG: VCBS repeat-containing protein [Victivallales bacterium]|nr:VCBS repeat-containing protein [Victivallales bacterium]